MFRRPPLALLLASAFLACMPTRREIDTTWPDVPGRDDAGTDAPEVEGDAGEDGDAPDAEADVVPLPEETENNDPFHGGEAEPLAGSVTLAGRIGPPGPDAPDWDVFAVTGAAGQMLRVTAYPTSGSGPDLAVRILRLDGDGNVAWERTGDDPATLSVYRDAFLPASGQYLVVLSDRANFSPSPGGWRGDTGMTWQLSVSLYTVPPSVVVPALPWTWSGAVSPPGFIQTVTFTPAAGTRIEALLATGNPSAFDPLLTVWDAGSGSVVVEDDDAGGGSDALVRCDASGAPLVFVIDHVTAGGTVAPNLTLSLRTLDPAFEAEPNDRAASADVVIVGAPPVEGTIAAPAGGVEDRDLFRFEALAGRSYAVAVQRMGGSTSDVDPAVAAWRSAAGTARLVPENPLAFADDSPLRGDVDARLVVAPRRSGPLFLEVRDARNVAAERAGTPPVAGGSGHRYALGVTSVVPPAVIDLGDLASPALRDDAADSGGTADVFRFAAAAGTPARFELTDLAPAGAPFAPLVWLADRTGTTVLLVLEPPARGSADAFAFVAGAGGTLAAADRLGAGDPAWNYRLAARTLAAAAIVESSAPDDDLADAQPLAWTAAVEGVVVTGTLDASAGAGADLLDVYRVLVAPGARVVAFTGSAAGDSLDTVLILRSADGAALAENDDVPGGESLLSTVDSVAPSDGVVFVEVGLWGLGASGGYALFVGAP
ncbi:MAG: hypothetical protein HY905_08485 [Deltaproteobacteria bacterium]|nr:hypothetical protein [Deltaproteobacteria bacterium]